LNKPISTGIQQALVADHIVEVNEMVASDHIAAMRDMLLWQLFPALGRRKFKH
jgi:hypothetical protein